MNEPNLAQIECDLKEHVAQAKHHKAEYEKCQESIRRLLVLLEAADTPSEHDLVGAGYGHV